MPKKIFITIIVSLLLLGLTDNNSLQNKNISDIAAKSGKFVSEHTSGLRQVVAPQSDLSKGIKDSEVFTEVKTFDVKPEVKSYWEANGGTISSYNSLGTIQNNGLDGQCVTTVRHYIQSIGLTSGIGGHAIDILNNFPTPATPSENWQIKEGYENIESGDIVFFKQELLSHTFGHIMIVYSVDHDNGIFTAMHSNANDGLKTSLQENIRLDSLYPQIIKQK